MTMQTLWTRASRFGSTCVCPQCASSARGVSRRAAGSATRRMPRYFTTSTFLYSGIFAAATTFDAKLKKERREQWDQAIADIKDELEQPQGTERSLERKCDETGKGTFVLPAFDAESPLVEFGSCLDSSILRRAKHWAPQSTSGLLEVNNLAPQSLYASSHRKLKHLSRPWTESKLERVRLCMDKLQLDIMEELDRTGLSKEAAQYVPGTYGEYIEWSSEVRRKHFQQKLSDIARLRREKDTDLPGWQRSTTDVPLSAYQMDDEGQFVGGARYLNQHLQILFRRRARGRITQAEFLAKVAHRLSVSSAPPNVDTFNTLIVGFAHLQEKSLFDCTTLALDHTRVRPNETTLASIFRYDTETEDYAHFRLWLGRVRGEGIGLHAARRNLVIKDDNKARLFRRPDSNSGAIIQLPHPTPMVFNALIGGIQKFFGFDQALEVCRDMSEEGWGLSMAGMCPLLKECSERGDWKSGQVIWDKIQALKSKSRRRKLLDLSFAKNRSIWISEKIQLPTYVAMLKLCKNCNRKDIFEEVAKEATNEHRIEVSKLAKMISTPYQNLQRRKEPFFGYINANQVRGSDELRQMTRKRSRNAGPKHLEKSQIIGQEPVVSSPPPSTAKPLVRLTSFAQYHTADSTTSQEQLHGLIPGNQHLDEYELYERPMSMTS